MRRVRATLLIIMAAWSGLCFGDTICWNSRRGFESFSPNWPAAEGAAEAGRIENHGPGDLEILTPVRGDKGDFDFRFKLRNHHNNPIKRYKYQKEGGGSGKAMLPEWGIIVKDASRGYISFEIKCEETESDGVSTSPCLQLTVRGTDMMEERLQFRSPNQGSNILNGLKGVDTSGSHNFYKIAVVGDRINLYGGNQTPELLFSGMMPEGLRADSIGFFLTPGGCVELSEMRLSSRKGKPDLSRATWTDTELLEEYLRGSKDVAEGYWQPLDRELEETMLKMGGDYRFAIVKETDGYDLIYLSGARVNKENWHPGIPKAHLSPSGIEGIWNVSWTDSMYGEISRDVKAQFEGTATLLIQFPYHNSKLRLQKTSD